VTVADCTSGRVVRRRDGGSHIKVVYHDAAHNELATRSSTPQCVTDNRSYQSTVSISSYGSTAEDTGSERPARWTTRLGLGEDGRPLESG
jgi:hypothetical protein